MVRAVLIGTRSWRCPAAATRTPPSTLWTVAPMTTSTNPSGPRNCWHASGVPYAGGRENRASLRTLVTGELEIDLLHRRVRSRGQEVHLPVKPYAVLRVLAENAGKVLTHEELLRAVWGEQCVGRVQYLRLAIRELRRKLEDDPAHPRISSRKRGSAIAWRCKSAPSIVTSAASCRVRTEHVMNDRSERDHRPSPDALLQQAAQEGARPSQDFPGRRAGGRQDLRDADDSPGKAPRGDRRCRRHRRDPWPERDRGAARKAWRSFRAGWSNIRATGSRRWTSMPFSKRRPAAGAGRRARPHQRTRQPPSQALHGCRGTPRAPASMSTRRSTSSTSKA